MRDIIQFPTKKDGPLNDGGFIVTNELFCVLCQTPEKIGCDCFDGVDVEITQVITEVPEDKIIKNTLDLRIVK